jgi:hypothetical protein
MTILLGLTEGANPDPNAGISMKNMVYECKVNRREELPSSNS